MAAAAENYYASNNNSYVSDYEGAVELGEVKEKSSGEPVEYRFQILTREAKHMVYQIPKNVYVNALERYSEPHHKLLLNEFTELVYEQFDAKKLCMGLARSFLENALVLKRPDTFLIRLDPKDLDLSIDTVLAVASFYFYKSYVFIDLLCANNEYSGAGTVLLNKIHQIARAAGKTRAALNSVNKAVGFYKKRKYKPVRMPFTPANVPMSRRLTKKNVAAAAASGAASAGAGAKGGKRLRRTHKNLKFF